MAILDDVKSSLRINGKDFDIELDNIIEACKSDLELSGVAFSNINEENYLIKRAIINYCKAEFGFDNPDSEKFRQAYESLKYHLAISYGKE